MRDAKLITFLMLAALTGSMVVRTADAGSIISWGAIAFDSKVLDATDFIAISAGSSHTLALKSDGSIVGWGLNWAGLALPPEGNNFIAIAAGHLQSLAIRKEPCPYRLVGDLNDDCRVDYLDYAAMAEN